MAGAASNNRRPESMGEFAARRAREQLDKFSGAVSAAAHDAYGKYIRTGKDIHLPTTDDVLAFGAEVMDRGRERLRTAVARSPTRSTQTASQPHRPRPAEVGKPASPPRTMEPRWIDALNRNPYAKGAAGYAGMVSGWAPGAVRGGAHMLEGALDAAMFANRAINPGLDYATSAPGHRVGDQVLAAGMAVADYANRVARIRARFRGTRANFVIS